VPGVTDDKLLKMYSEIEPELQAGAYLPYRRVLAEAVREIGKRLERPVTDTEAQDFAESLKQWQPFPDTVAALQSLAGRCKLAIVSNIDDDLFAATREHLKTDFAFVVTAQQEHDAALTTASASRNQKRWMQYFEFSHQKE